MLAKLWAFLVDWFTPAPMYPADPNCPHCHGISYDASGLHCSCVYEERK